MINRGKPWKKDDIEKLCFLFKQGKSDLELAELLGRTAGSIRTRRSKLDLARVIRVA